MLAKLTDALAALPDWNHDACDAALRGVAAAEGVKAGLLINATRVAIVGRAVAPPLFDTMVVIGRDAVLRRMHRALEYLAAHPKWKVTERLRRDTKVKEIPATASAKLALRHR